MALMFRDLHGRHRSVFVRAASLEGFRSVMTEGSPSPTGGSASQASYGRPAMRRSFDARTSRLRRVVRLLRTFDCVWVARHERAFGPLKAGGRRVEWYRYG